MRAVAALVLFGGLSSWAQSPWAKLEFLLGHWTGVAGEKDSQIGAGQGDFSFELQLNRSILLRRNHSEYDSGERHDDLLVIYLDPPNATPPPPYFHAQEHLISYKKSFPPPHPPPFQS